MKVCRNLFFFSTDGYEPGVMMDNGLSSDYDENGMYNGNADYVMGGRWVTLWDW